MDSPQRFTLQGAVAIPGIYPESRSLDGAHKSNFVAGKDIGLQIHLDDQKIRLGSVDASEALAIASTVKAELEKIKSAFNAHFHTGHGVKTLPGILSISEVAIKNVVAT